MQYQNQERRKAQLPYKFTMQNNQNPTPNGPNRKQLAPRDMMILALVILGITRLDFANMNSFHVLLLFLMVLLLMLRWGNMRKEAVRKQAMNRYKNEYETDSASQAGPRPVWADAPAEPVAAEEIAAEETALVAEKSETSADTEEKTEE